MILILGSDQDDSTDGVIDWLYKAGVGVVKISLGDLLTLEKIEIKDGKSIIYLRDKIIIEEQLKSIWIRKWQDNKAVIRDIIFKSYRKKSSEVNVKEMDIVHSFLELCFPKTKILTGSNHLSANKPFQLLIAQSFGLKTPISLVASNRLCIKETFRKENNLITKLMGGMHVIKKNSKYYASYTSRLKKIPETFIPSLVQQCIEKEFEIRTFYINGKCFSASIFSQSNERTQIDYRRYDYKSPSRIVAYKLSDEVEDKIRLFMDGMKLNTGSLDFIMSKDGTLYFLEVNPEGIFDNISHHCNYNLEKEIADFLLGF